MYDLTSVWTLKTKHNKAVVAGGGEGNGKMLVKGYQVSVIKWVSSRWLMHSMAATLSSAILGTLLLL